MASLDGSAPLSTSPLSISLPDNHDPLARPRHSPTLGRSFDPDDPQVRERQRTMDVDLAFQLSRARRETAHHSPPSSIFDLNQTQGPPSPGLNYTPIPSLSLREEREIDIARGNGMTATDESAADDETIGLLRLESLPSLSDLDTRHHQPSADAILFSAIEGNVAPPQAHPQEDDVTSPRYDLPIYQANVPFTAFDFSKMEEFAAREKTKLGLSSPVDLHLRRLAHPNIVASSSEEPSEVQQLPRLAEPSSETPSPAATEGIKPSVFPSPIQIPSPAAEDTTTGRSLRHRKLSQSNPRPRTHRKGVGGKLALFENNGTLSARLGAVLGGAGGSGGGQDHYVPPQGHRDGIGGILNTGHDRPFRFSFYSNALAATIHARSLGELPAEGQSFKDLFTGIHPPSSPDFRRSKVDVPHVNGASGAPYGTSKDGNYDTKNNGTSDSDSTTWWLDVTSPTEEEMKLLSEVFSIHPLTTEDILMEETREKIELFRNYYFVCFRSFEQDQYSPTYLEPLNMYIIVFREGILSFHFQPTPHPQNVRRRIKQFKDYIAVTSDWISYALIDDITDAFGPLIQNIEYEVDSIDELVLILKEAEQSDMLRRIGTCRKKVMGLLRLMGNKADVVKGLAKRCNENWRVAPTSDIGLYLSDIQDHLITMTQNLNHYEKILSRSHSNYLAQISIEMTDANNQINDVLSKLTALGTVLIPMNLVTGLWGMNVHVPGQEVPGYGWFIGIIVFLAAFAVLGGYGTYRLMIRK